MNITAKQILEKYKNRVTTTKPAIVESFHLKDDLLAGITFEELVTTIQSNEPSVDEKVVMKVWEELLEAKLADAKQLLKTNMQKIISEVR